MALRHQPLRRLPLESRRGWYRNQMIALAMLPPSNSDVAAIMRATVPRRAWTTCDSEFRERLLRLILIMRAKWVTLGADKGWLPRSRVDRPRFNLLEFPTGCTPPHSRIARPVRST